METNSGKVQELCQSGKVGTMMLKLQACSHGASESAFVMPLTTMFNTFTSYNWY